MVLVEGIFKSQNARKIRKNTLLGILPQKTKHCKFEELVYKEVSRSSFKKKHFFLVNLVKFFYPIRLGLVLVGFFWLK